MNRATLKNCPSTGGSTGDKARVRSSNRGGDVSLTLTVEDRDYEYGARKFIHLVHEVYMVFLSDGRYYEYMVDKFDLDPDRI